MNATVIYKESVNDGVLDDMSKELSAIIAEVLQVPGGNLAIVLPEQVSLEFAQASTRDVGADIRIMVFARSNDPRTLTENDRAKAILDKVTALIAKTGNDFSVNVRLYLMDIGVAEHVRR